MSFNWINWINMAVVVRLIFINVIAARKGLSDSFNSEHLIVNIFEQITYFEFPSEHWTRIRTNNVSERLNREIRRRTKAVSAFPDGNSALMLVCARLRHVVGIQWGGKKYMNMKCLEIVPEDNAFGG